MCADAVLSPVAQRSTIEFGGPEALTPLEAVAIFERLTQKPFQLEHIPEETLRAQLEGATDPMQKTFAGLMLGYAVGDAIGMGEVVSRFGITLTSVAEYARKVLGKDADTAADNSLRASQ